MLTFETHAATAPKSGPAEPLPGHADWIDDIAPDCLGKLMQVGYWAVCRGCFVEANSIFQALAAIRPASEIPLLGLTVMELSVGNLDQATKWFDAAAALGPDASHTCAMAEVLEQCRKQASH